MNNILPKTTAEAVRTYDLMVLLDAYTGEVPTSRRFSEHELDVPETYCEWEVLPGEILCAAVPFLDDEPCALPERLHGHLGQHAYVSPIAALVDCEPWTNGTDEGNTRYSA